MAYLREVEVPQRIAKSYSTGDGTPVLRGTTKLNIFVGANNSGKSRLLRELFADEDLRFVPNTYPVAELDEIFRRFVATIENVVSRYGVAEIGALGQTWRTFTRPERVTFGADPTREFREMCAQLAAPGISLRFANSGFHRDDEAKRDIAEAAEQAQSAVRAAAGGAHLSYKPRRVYVPTLRTLRNVAPKHAFRDRVVQDHFPWLKDTPRREDIFTGLEMYDRTRDLLLGTLQERAEIAEFQDFLAATFFKQQVALIPRVGGDVLYFKVGNEEERPIHELGDGLQHLIIISFPLFVHRNEEMLMFVEEPELFLHPSMQRVLVETFTSRANLQTFVATHSNHLLDVTLDVENITVFRFKKEVSAEGAEASALIHVENVTANDDQSLRLLGARASSLFLSNCTIWIEGVSERIYLRKFLEIYQKSLNNAREYKEDVHFSFVEYSGNNLAHWSFSMIAVQTHRGCREPSS